MNLTSWPISKHGTNPFREPEVPDRIYPPILDSASFLPSESELIRVTTDFAPAAVNDFPDRILGPWALVLDPSRPEEKAIFRFALAAACFANPDDDQRSPFEQWTRRNPAPPRHERQGFRSIERTPWRLWSIDSNQQFIDIETGERHHLICQNIAFWPGSQRRMVWARRVATADEQVATLVLGVPDCLEIPFLLELLQEFHDPGRAHLRIRRSLERAWSMR